VSTIVQRGRGRSWVITLGMSFAMLLIPTPTQAASPVPQPSITPTVTPSDASVITAQNVTAFTLGKTDGGVQGKPKVWTFGTTVFNKVARDGSHAKVGSITLESKKKLAKYTRTRITPSEGAAFWLKLKLKYLGKDSAGFHRYAATPRKGQPKFKDLVVERLKLIGKLKDTKTNSGNDGPHNWAYPYGQDAAGTITAQSSSVQYTSCVTDGGRGKKLKVLIGVVTGFVNIDAENVSDVNRIEFSSRATLMQYTTARVNWSTGKTSKVKLKLVFMPVEGGHQGRDSKGNLNYVAKVQKGRKLKNLLSLTVHGRHTKANDCWTNEAFPGQ